jgi:hypothetical protein
MLINTGGHAKGNEEAEAEMMPELRAIFKMTTSTALASPPSLTVAKVNATMTPKVAKTTNNMNPTDALSWSKQAKHLNEDAPLYEPRAHAAHNGGL